MELNDFKWGLKNYGLKYNNEEVLELFKFFDKDSSGSIDFNEFMTAFRVIHIAYFLIYVGFSEIMQIRLSC